nr:unnamed protein product [Callosobruchus analis]
MRGDDISLAAKTDNLICAVAERYMRSHRGSHFIQVASRKMRQLGSLLIEAKKHAKCGSLIKLLEPSNFDLLVRCTKTISKYDPINETYGAPSLAANMGTLLKDCIDVAQSILIQKGSNDSQALEKLRSLKELISNEWRYEVSTLANHDLQQKKWNKPSMIPLGEDLKLVNSYLNAEGAKYYHELTVDQKSKKAFSMLQELTYVMLIFLNRRRVGELQRMTVHSYVKYINNSSTDKEFDSFITEGERLLMNSFKRVVIRGKRNRGVPVLFTEQMVKYIDLLLKVRTSFVPKQNIYLFASMTSENCIAGSKVMYKHVRGAGAKNPASLTSTKLRKHLATMAQVINLSQQDLEQLANFMGHTSEIHNTYYRLPSDVYQTAKVSKLLLMCGEGRIAEFKGKSLDEIDLNLDIEDEESSDEEIQLLDEASTSQVEETEETQETEKVNLHLN